jgi:hypothetical protein
MHAILLNTHNLLRWVVLALGVLALVKAYQGIAGDRPYAAARRTGILFTASLHVQLLLGLTLFVTSPFIKTAMSDMRTTMADAATRFFVAEHPTVMVAAVVLMTIGGIVAKNAANDAARHRKALVFIVITMLMILWGIPWQRPLFPGMG